MLEEARAAADCVAQQLQHDWALYDELGCVLRAAPPAGVVTLARGSSDHAAAYCAYLIMMRLGHITASLPMSLLTLNQAPLIGRNWLTIAISQSGQSPDLIESLRYFGVHGATTLALVNDAASPLAQTARHCLPLRAGPERSVAATKSFIASLVASARLVAHWQNDQHFLQALHSLPQALQLAAQSDWSQAVDALVPAKNIMVLGRGTAFSLAAEAALKFKEVAAIQAEAFSDAEVKHGPMALVDDGYLMLLFATRGPTQVGMLRSAAEMRQRGARVLLVAPSDVAERDLTLPTAAAPDLDPIVAIQAFYIMAAQVAAARGMNPDQPRHLSKVTKTD